MPFDLVVRPSLRVRRTRPRRRENRPASAERDFGFGRPEAPAAGSIHDSTPVFMPSNHRFVSTRPRIDHRADRCPNTHARQHRRRAEGSSPTSPTSGEIAATGTTIGSRNTSTRYISTNPRTLPSLLRAYIGSRHYPIPILTSPHPPTHPRKRSGRAPRRG